MTTRSSFFIFCVLAGFLLSITDNGINAQTSDTDAAAATDTGEDTAVNSTVPDDAAGFDNDTFDGFPEEYDVNATSASDDATPEFTNTTSAMDDGSDLVNVTDASANETEATADESSGNANVTDDFPSADETLSYVTDNVTSDNATDANETVADGTVDFDNFTEAVENVTETAENVTETVENVTETVENVTETVENVTDVVENVTTEAENVTDDITTEEPQMTTPEEAENTTSEWEPEETTEPTLTTTTTADVANATDIDEHVVVPTNEKADFIVWDAEDENPCLLASLNITLHFQYRVQEGLIRETYDTVSRRSADDDSSYTGQCEDSLSTLSISWNNNTFTLNLTFILQDMDSGDDLEMDVLAPGANVTSSSSWLLHQVSLSYDTANQGIFPLAANPSQQSVQADNLNLFKTHMGMSYMCQTPEAVSIQFKDVDLVFNFVHLMPFGAQSKFFNNDTVICSGDLNTVPSEDSSLTVPLIVAATLATIVIVIVTAYAIQRVVTKHRRQADYKQMD